MSQRPAFATLVHVSHDLVDTSAASILAAHVTRRLEPDEIARGGIERLQLAMEAGALGDWSWNATNDRVTLSAQASLILGVDVADTISGRGMWRRVHSTDLERGIKTVRAALASRTTFALDCRIADDASGERWIMVHGRRVYENDGCAGEIIGVVQDITARKHLERAARFNDQHLRAALDALRLHHQCLQTLSARLLETQERERRTVSHELREEVCQALAAIKMNLRSLQRRSPAPQLEQCMHIADGVLQRVRDLSVDLLPPQLADLGLEAAVGYLIERTCGPDHPEVTVQISLGPQRLALELETTCFRVIQEALANAHRHAAAKHVWIVLTHLNDELQLTVSDDGQGFDVQISRERAAGSGTSGLTAMLERVRLAGGHMEIASADKLGTEIVVTLPAVAPALPTWAV